MFRNLRAGFFMLGLLVLAWAALMDDLYVLSWSNTKGTTLARFGAVGLLAAILIWFVVFRSAIRPPRRTALGRPKPVEPSDKDIRDAQLAAGKKYSPDTIELFFNMLGSLPHYLVRITERVEPIEETSQLCVTNHLLYQVDGKSPQVILVPLARVEKGTLLDDFVVTDASGNSVPTLSYTQLRGLLALTIEGLIETALLDSDLGDSAIGSMRQKIHKVTRDLVIAVCGPRPRRRPSKDAVEQEKIVRAQGRVNDILNSVEGLPISSGWQRRIKNLCRQYIDHYVIVAKIHRIESSDSYLTLTYSHRVPFETVAPSKHDKWRGFLGLKPSVIDVPLNLFALHVQAYHQEVAVEPGQYVFDHHLERLFSRQHVAQTDLGTEDFKPYVRLYYDEARPNAHLYIRHQKGTPPLPPDKKPAETTLGSDAKNQQKSQHAGYPDRLKSVIQLREIPPGALGAATVIALASAAIISFFALTHVGLDINPNPPTSDAAQIEQIRATLNSDVPALLLATPAFVGVLIGSWLDLSHLRRASLTTYLALAMTMFLSLGSALYFVLDANHMLPTAQVMPVIGSAKVTTDWIWLGLMAVAVTHFCFLARMVIDESRYYSQRVKKRVDTQLRNSYN
jgi:hypothetical protein